jgi:two-component system, cell cycle response regulator DivK
MSTVDLTNWEILIVDDEPDNLTVLDTLLNFFDARVTSANSGEEALELLKTKKFKLGLFDIQMPKVSGWDLIKWVRGNDDPAIREMCVIAVTALAMRGDEDRVLQAGFDGYVAKPIDATVFMESVQTVLSRPKILQLPVAQESKAEPEPIVDSVGISEKMSQVISEARTHSERGSEIDLSNVADLLESNGHLLDVRYELETKDDYPNNGNGNNKATKEMPAVNAGANSAGNIIAAQENGAANGESQPAQNGNGNHTAPTDTQTNTAAVSTNPAGQTTPDMSVNAALAAQTTPSPTPSDAVQAVQEAK